MTINETASQLFKRLNFPSIVLDIGGRAETFHVGNIFEIQIISPCQSSSKVSIIQQFMNFFPDGDIVILSPGLGQSPEEDGGGIPRTAKRFHIFNILQFIAALEIIGSKSSQSVTLIILDSLAPVLIAEKGYDGYLSPESLVTEALSSLKRITNTKNAIAVWINSAPKSSGLRTNSRDNLFVLWKSFLLKSIELK